MGQESKIEWTEATVNLWWGCVEVGVGCANCYAKTLAKRWGKDLWGADKPREQKKNAFKNLDSLQRKAAAEDRTIKVFIDSMSDLAEILPDTHESAHMMKQARLALFSNIENGEYPNLILIWSTHRIGNVPKVVFPWWMEPGRWPENLWLLASVSNQAEADRDVPKLLAIPAKVRGLSAEPLIGEVELPLLNYSCLKCGYDFDSPWDCKECGWENEDGSNCDGSLNRAQNGIHWVICGGESGHGARPIHPDWARSLRDQCTAVGVPFFFKQWGEWLPWTHFGDNDVPDDPEISRYHAKVWFEGKWEDHGGGWMDAADYDWDACHVGKVGKKRAGRLLDGREWNEFPSVTER